MEEISTLTWGGVLSTGVSWLSIFREMLENLYKCPESDTESAYQYLYRISKNTDDDESQNALLWLRLLFALPVNYKLS